MRAIIGSIALNWYVEEATNQLVRKPADVDLVSTYDDFTDYLSFCKSLGDQIKAVYPIDSGKKMVFKTQSTVHECEIAWPGSSAEALLKLIREDKDSVFNQYVYPSIDVLYMLKMSHRYLKDSPHFLKTMDDIHLMRMLGAKIRSEHVAFYQQRMKDTYTNKLPSLKRNKEDFFSGDGIIYEWDHDTIHEAVKHMDKPAYQYFSGGEVWSDMKVFETLPERIKLLAVLEESMVLAAERSQLAFPDKDIDPRWSFEYALQKVCSSITGGKFREYAWENYYKVIDMYNEFGYDYMYRVHRGVLSGVVKRVT